MWCMTAWCLDEIFFVSINILHHNWCLDIVLEEFCLSSSLAMKIHSPMQPKIALLPRPCYLETVFRKFFHSLWSSDALWSTWSFTTGPTLTLRRRVTVNTPFPREIRQGWGFQSIKYMQILWNLTILRWHLRVLRWYLTTLRRSSHPCGIMVQVPCWFQFYAGACLIRIM